MTSSNPADLSLEAKGLLEQQNQENNARKRGEGVPVKPETSEREPIVSGRSPVPNALNAEQLDYFTNLIQDNPPELSSIIDNIKKTFPDQLGDIIPTTEDELNNLTPEEFKELEKRRKSYKQVAQGSLDVGKASLTSGEIMVLPDPVKSSFVDKVETQLKNHLKFVTEVEKFGNTILDIGAEISNVTRKISDASQQFIGQISNAVQKGLVKFINSGLKRLSQFFFSTLPAPAALAASIAADNAAVGPATALFKAAECVTSKVTDAMTGVISDMLTASTKNMLNAPVCAIQQFIGAMAAKITTMVDSILGPLLGPLTSILSPIGLVFNIKSFIQGGIDFIGKVKSLFQCSPPKRKTASHKYVKDQGLRKDRDDQESQTFLDAAMEAATAANEQLERADDALAEGVPSLLSDFEQQYGQWSIFGSKVSEAGNQGIGGDNCYTGNVFKCGAPTVEIFGGRDGSGAFGQAILGNFVNKIDKDDIFGTVTKTASIVGVNITNPGRGYTEAPLVAFTDSCDQGYGAYGRAEIDRNIKSPTYGQITRIVMISEGENYPVNGYSVAEIDDQIPDFYITDVVIEDSGSGYEQGDSFAGTDLRPVISEDDGSVIAVEILKQIPYNRLPELFVLSKTGINAKIKPIMSIKRLPPREEVLKVVNCVGTFTKEAKSIRSGTTGGLTVNNTTSTQTTTVTTPVEDTTTTTSTTEMAAATAPTPTPASTPAPTPTPSPTPTPTPTPSPSPSGGQYGGGY